MFSQPIPFRVDEVEDIDRRSADCAQVLRSGSCFKHPVQLVDG